MASWLKLVYLLKHLIVHILHEKAVTEYVQCKTIYKKPTPQKYMVLQIHTYVNVQWRVWKNIY